MHLSIQLSTGKVVTAYRVRDGKSKMIGKGNPLWPEAFYKRVGDVITLKRGDKLMARCDYVSNRDVATFCGFLIFINFKIYILLLSLKQINKTQ